MSTMVLRAPGSTALGGPMLHAHGPSWPFLTLPSPLCPGERQSWPHCQSPGPSSFLAHTVAFKVRTTHLYFCWLCIQVLGTLVWGRKKAGHKYLEDSKGLRVTAASLSPDVGQLHAGQGLSKGLLRRGMPT